MKVVVTFDVHGYTDAALFLTALKELREEHPSWKLVGVRLGDEPMCPECGAPMSWRPELQEYACSHPE